MTSVSTEDFPYTAAYVTQLLGVNEAELMNYVRALGMMPKRDERTNHLIFTQKDTEILRKAIEMNRQGKSLTEDLTRVAQDSESSVEQVVKQVLPSPLPMAEPEAPLPPATFGNRMTASGLSTASASGGNLAMVVEAVSSAKEGILNDMSRLLDDKLAGLDEVVVELIRCKSENDALKQKAKLLASEKEALQDELSRFSTAGFGFYRKD